MKRGRKPTGLLRPLRIVVHLSREEKILGDALAAAGRGDWETAAELARDCATIESEWGDCPTWGPFRDAVVAAAAQVEAAEGGERQ